VISAGEFFELLRPAALVLAMLASIWVLANARRRGFRLYAGLAWALGTFFLPFVVLPLYLIVLILRHSATARLRSTDENRSEPNTESRALVVKYRLLLPAAYGIVLFGVTGVYLYRDYRSVDAHLARATQAKLVSQPAKTIREYRAALALEDNPHTHKLLGLELADTKQWGEALKEFRLAERGGEPDESLPFRVAQALSARGEHVEAVVEYQRFLKSHACVQALPDERCEAARKALENAR
jgi:tetratricopeptide (TPR) repeat protein